jgi:hypothetical protein
MLDPLIHFAEQSLVARPSGQVVIKLAQASSHEDRDGRAVASGSVFAMGLCPPRSIMEPASTVAAVRG